MISRDLSSHWPTSTRYWFNFHQTKVEWLSGKKGLVKSQKVRSKPVHFFHIKSDMDKFSGLILPGCGFVYLLGMLWMIIDNISVGHPLRLLVLPLIVGMIWLTFLLWRSQKEMPGIRFVLNRESWNIPNKGEFMWKHIDDIAIVWQNKSWIGA